MIYNHPFSKPKRQSTERPLHFPTAQDFKTIKHARPALSAWAILLCVSECAKQIRRLSKKSAGLHLRLSQNARTRATQASATPSWERILEVGSSVGMENLVKSVAPLVMYFVMAMLKSKRRQRSESSETEARGPRPSLHVAISIVGSLVFGSNRHANALAFGNSVWMFANRAHYAVFPVLSHFGVTTVYQSLLNGLRSLASMDQISLRADLETESKQIRLVLDNTQSYIRARTRGFGRDNRMQVGTAATAIVLQQHDPLALSRSNWDPAKGREAMRTLTMGDLEADLDSTHLGLVTTLHWLRILVEHVPALSSYQKEVDMLFKERAQKCRMADNRKTEIHPLGTSDANEATADGLLEAINDFMEQLGLGKEKIKDKLLIVSGDGMTFNGLLRLKRYTERSTTDDYRALRWVLPILETWHTTWTDLSRVVRTNWGPRSTADPSCLGHSATAINHPMPTNMKKVDFYSAQRTVTQVFTARVLDCWCVLYDCKDLKVYFNSLKKDNRLPGIEDLLDDARLLGRRYCSIKAYERAVSGRTADTRPAAYDVPLGTPWAPRKRKDDDKMEIDDPSNNYSRSDGEDSDHSLANSTMFMCEALLNLEASAAVEDGDMGRVLEVFKAWIFTFASSTNHNYTQYLFRLWVMYKWEFTPALRHLIKQNMLVNLEGIPKRSHEGDLMQEHNNRDLEGFIQHKGAEYGAPFIREAVAPNIHRFRQIRSTRLNDVGLNPLSKLHGQLPHEQEIERLMQIYAEEELHRYRPGRRYGHLIPNSMEEGYKALETTKLNRMRMSVIGIEDDDTIDEEEEPSGENINDSHPQDFDAAVIAAALGSLEVAELVGQAEASEDEQTSSDDGGEEDASEGIGEESEAEAEAAADQA
ncbi:hypothetical protein M407DRAFT_65941 [Tulasnella calospora MUT 4182]|uniref:DUF6589 domain-containing protein n=1 Tax=Tulasnella calospora MUT 4182 TaxID=1051891 RepID=A0A0C3QVY6_9AGAM|nr:hypothetical protein M407DRAFT_65941 [Tulasnella calospora MUT 4182]